jgi:leucine dehydrogenase
MALKRQMLKISGFEQVALAEDPTVGLRSIIAIHSTALGPACGGIRLLPYPSQEEALNDVLRLAQGMSYKSSLAGIGFGGGKSVILLDPRQKNAPLFHSFGDFIESFGGKYISAKDMNIDASDLLRINERTQHVLGIEGVVGSSGEPSAITARGVFRGLEATVENLTGTRKLSGLRVCVQGVGHVGYNVAELLHQAGAEIWVTDTRPEAVERAVNQLGAHPVALDEEYDLPVDVFCPCALGGILNASTIPRLKCRAVVGAANNQLKTPADGMHLHERGILYAPDYAVNSGGIINIFVEYSGKYDAAQALRMADGVHETVEAILRRAKERKIPPFVLADQLAEERIAHAKKSAGHLAS